MARIRRWFKRTRRGREEVWSEPGLPPYVKVNPSSPPGAGQVLQPGDISMGSAAEEFLALDETGEEEAAGEPDGGLG